MTKVAEFNVETALGKTYDADGKAYCCNCQHAVVGRGEICRCVRGVWKGRRLGNIGKVRHTCNLFESMDEGMPPQMEIKV